MRIGLGIKTLLLVAAVLMVAKFVQHRFGRQSDDAKTLKAYNDFKVKFNKHTSSEQDQYRFLVFRTNYKHIQAHNSKKTNTYTLGVTPFADLTPQEFKRKYLMSSIPKVQGVQKNNSSKLAAPKVGSIDWRQKGVVSDVKDQGSCGSCWSFSVTGSLESAYRIFKGQSVILSEQQLVDCCGSKGYQCEGCSGAWPEWAFNYIKDNGITTEAKYPYKGYEGTCKVDSGEYKIADYEMIPQGDVDAVKSALQQQPLSICVEAANWFLYSSGIFNDCGNQLDHAVTLVGYMENESWLVLNSWSTSWGEQGYIRIRDGNVCGLADHAIRPSI